jgi:hypothetical protein
MKDKILEWLDDHPHMTIDLHKNKNGYDVVVRYHTFQTEKNAVSFCKFLQYSLSNEQETTETRTIH